LTAGSGIVRSLSENAIATFKAQGNIIKGTRRGTGGTYDNRKNVKEGLDNMEKESNMRVDGSL
jgi:hypothetical protein